MSRRVISKWRPPLALVLGGTLVAVFAMPILGIGYFRLAGGVLGWAETAWMIFWLAFLVTGILGLLLWRLVLRPVRGLTAFAQSEGKIAPPTRFGTPEFSKLGQAMLQMNAALRGREAVLRSYADHVTHELKSPLTVIQGAAELLADASLPEPDRQRLLANIEDHTARMTALLDSQRELAKAQEVIAPGTCLLSDVLGAYELGVVQTDGEVPLPAQVMDIVATHLISNAKAQGADQVMFDLREGRLLIWDDGPGISPGNRAHIFDPFFTTRRDQGGTGMGLPIVQRMLQAQGADIYLTDAPGAEFEIRF